MFSNARNVVITGNATLTNHVIERTSAPRESDSLDEGIKILLEHVAKGAMHNSGERFDAPTCHPETRVALQQDVMGWADEPPDGQLVTWMFGPAGAGKSAIAQTISQKLHDKGQLTASFFFSRASSSRGRGDESALVATLAYQLSLNAPATKPFISRAVQQNPLIFDLSLDDQVQALITDPLTCGYRDNLASHCPRIIVVDGLDECRKGQNAQNRVVSALIKGIKSIPHWSHKLFITSRPEHNIVAIFRDYKPELLRKVELGNKWNPDEDIRTFLLAEFANIRRYHPYFESHSADRTWPSWANINVLVERSSGQFIYASVVIKYIKSEDYFDPAARLKLILELKNNEDRPYAELDELYKHIFSQIQGVEQVLTVLSLERMLSASELASSVDLAQFLSYFIGTCTEEIKFWLRPLVSILTWETDEIPRKGVIRYLHASLPDFLADESRSDTFCINSIPTAVIMMVIQRALDLLKDRDMSAGDIDFMRVLLMIPRHYAQKSPLRMDILPVLSNFNFAENVLSRMHMSQLSYELLHALGSHLEWILEESKSDPQKVLVKPLSQIQTWILERLAYKGFKLLNHTVQVDLWPFLTSSFLSKHFFATLEHMRRQVPYDTAAALQICGLPTFSYQVTSYTDDKVSNQAVFFRYLVCHIPYWLSDTTLLGRYAITGKRYAVALMCTSRYMLRLRKDQLVAIRKDDQLKFSHSMLVARRTFSNFVDHLPRSMELYFFVLHMYSVIVDHRPASKNPMATVTSARAYLLLMRKKFPFLSDPASPEYMKAQANAEATWIETKGDLYDPILSIQVKQVPNLTDSDSDSNLNW